MKRKFVCSTCKTSKNSATGETLYVLGTTTGLAVQPRETECWDCGEKRREQERKKQQNKRDQLKEKVA